MTIHRVPMRSPMAHRLWSAAVTLVFLAFWLYGLFFLLTLLSEVLELGWQFPLPHKLEVTARNLAGPDMPPPLLIGMLGFIPLAIWVGLTSLWSVVRLLLEWEEIEMQQDQIAVIRGLGPFRRTREIPRRDIHSVYLDWSRNSALAARVRGRRMILARLGTEVERRQLRDVMQIRYRPFPPDGIPAGWRSARETDGTTVILPPRGIWNCFLGCFGFIAAGWWALIGLAWILTPRAADSPLRSSTISYLIGILLVALMLAAAISREWMEVRGNWLAMVLRVGPWQFRRAYRDGTLELRYRYGRAGGFHLQMHEGQRTHTIHHSSYDYAELLPLGRFLAAQTGWKLTVAEQAK